MAHVDTDQHRPLGVENLGELQVEEVALDLRVNLAQDVGGLAQIELESVADSDDLRGDFELGEQLLVHLVVVLLAEHNDSDLGVAEHAIRPVHHVAQELVLHLIVIVLALELYPVRLLDADFELLARLQEVVVDAVGDIEVGPLALVGPFRVLVDHDPLLLVQVDGLLDRQSLQLLLAALDQLPRLQNLDLRRTQAEAIERDRILLNLNTPVLHRSLIREGLHHLLDLSELVRGVDPGGGERVAHASALADGVGDAVEQAELRRQVLVLLAHFDQEAGLVRIGHNLVVIDLEVAREFGIFTVPDELVRQRGHLEIDIVDAVGAPVAPVGDDGAVVELELHRLLPLVVAVAFALDLVDAVQAGSGRHELEDVVDGESDSELTLESGGLEARPHLQVHALDLHRVLHVEESRRAAQLLQIGFAEGLLQNDVDEVLAHVVILVVEGLLELDLRA